MTIDCPVCRRPFETPDIKVDLNSNTIIAGGKVVKIMPREAEILSVLAAAYPMPVSRQTLADRIFEKDKINIMQSPIGTISVHVNRLQRRLTAAHVPFAIVNDFGQGFHLEAMLDEAPEIVAAVARA